MSGSGPSSCPRLFEAEAMRDGRLTGTERASYEQHVSGCAACAREVRGLESLAAALRASGSEGADELRVRRERTRLLAAFDGGLVAPEGGAGRRRSLLVVGTAACAAIAAVSILWGRSRTPAPSVRATASATVHAEGDAEWSDRREGERETLLLQRGTLRVHVDHAGGGEGRLVVVLPDGELEDVGTTFTVSAKDGWTARVTVEEGRVLLRLRDRPAVVLGAGETWVADAPPPPSESPAPAEAVAEAVEAPPAAAAPRSARAPVASASSPDVSVEFRAAMSALDVGDNRAAAARFAAFLGQHPGDPRAEDAAYLRVIALQRSGDAQAMQQAAMTYLRLYPAGFRRAEIEPLAR
jgi:hypothetical protein